MVGWLMAHDYYPLDDEKRSERVQTTIRLSPEEDADVELISQIWNGLDELRKVQRSVKWKKSTVMERLIAVGISGFWRSVGGRPKTSEAREQWLRKALAELEKAKLDEPPSDLKKHKK